MERKSRFKENLALAIEKYLIINKNMANPMSMLTSIITGNKGSLLNVKLPVFSLSQGFSSSQYTSLGGVVSSITNSAQNLLQGARLAYCAGKMLTNPGMVLNMLDILGNSMLAAATEIASRLAGLIKGQITQALSQITGSISGLVNNIFGFINSVLDLYDAILNIIDSLTNIGWNDWEDFMSEEDCEYIFAMIAACMLNKFLGSKLQKLEQKLSNKIIETGSQLNSEIAENLADVNTVSSYIERETFMMNKATKQLNGLNNMIK
ncbi:MAG: hypothetical protein IJ341_12530 [Bacteroidales bacterium]|nr:hypothetical protein [Bacteroidales bacterium]